MFQNISLNQIITKHRENKLAHAYLIETNNIDKAMEDLKKIVKIINCPENFTTECSHCNLCNLISKNNLPSFKIIEPDGTSIKKNQIESLKMDFSTIPIYSKYNIYLIKNAEKLNHSSANSMLKFVEEPTQGILGFFLTTNKDIIIETIKSRCQILTLTYETNILEELNIEPSVFASYQEVIKEFLTTIDNGQTLNNKEIILKKFPERKDIINILKIIFEIYHHHYLRQINAQYNQNVIEIHKITDKIPKIAQKLQIISKILTEMSYNVNIELILDKLVIEMRGTNG